MNTLARQLQKLRRFPAKTVTTNIDYSSRKNLNFNCEGLEGWRRARRKMCQAKNRRLRLLVVWMLLSQTILLQTTKMCLDKEHKCWKYRHHWLWTDGKTTCWDTLIIELFVDFALFEMDDSVDLEGWEKVALACSECRELRNRVQSTGRFHRKPFQFFAYRFMVEWNSRVV